MGLAFKCLAIFGFALGLSKASYAAEIISSSDPQGPRLVLNKVGADSVTFSLCQSAEGDCELIGNPDGYTAEVLAEKLSSLKAKQNVAFWVKPATIVLATAFGICRGVLAPVSGDFANLAKMINISISGLKFFFAGAAIATVEHFVVPDYEQRRTSVEYAQTATDVNGSLFVKESIPQILKDLNNVLLE